MSYKALVDRNISKAFRLAKDFAIEVTFVKSINTDFNFSSAELEQDGVNINTKAVVVNSSKNASAKSMQLMFKASDADLNVYDSVIINGITWKVGPQLSSPGAVITMITIFKDAND